MIVRSVGLILAQMSLMLPCLGCSGDRPGPTSRRPVAIEGARIAPVLPLHAGSRTGEARFKLTNVSGETVVVEKIHADCNYRSIYVLHGSSLARAPLKEPVHVLSGDPFEVRVRLMIDAIDLGQTLQIALLLEGMPHIDLFVTR